MLICGASFYLCPFLLLAVDWALGRWSLPLRRERKVRTPQGSMLRKVRRGRGRKSASMESVTENIPPRCARLGIRVRVKRRGKSPPPGERSPGHDKPHAVQGQTETPGRLSGRGGNSGTRLGYRSHACRKAPLARSDAAPEMNDHRRDVLSKRPGTEFGLRPEKEGCHGKPRRPSLGLVRGEWRLRV